MNAITRQQTSIVDATPGTTADVKATLMELHDVGPAKLFDTAGIDEQVGRRAWPPPPLPRPPRARM
jgi:predicted GTPase